MFQPHKPIPVEPTFDEFVESQNGKLVKHLIDKNPDFDNADYLFSAANVIAELKEITTEFHLANGHAKKLHEIFVEFERRGEMTWEDVLAQRFPREFRRQQMRLFRPPIQRILKKANRQIRVTKSALERENASGVLFVVNDGFTAVSPVWVHGLLAESLVHSYGSIECLVYMTVNSYVGIPNDDYARLIWTTSYADTAPDELVRFIDDLGRGWRKFLEAKIGPFDVSSESPDRTKLLGSEIVLPGRTRSRE